MQRRIKVLGTGAYLPPRVVTGRELDAALGVKPGTTEELSGVQSRRYAGPEDTNSRMGARAARAALEDAGLGFSDIDLLVSTSGTREQAIPCTASLIQRELGQGESGTPCFDVDSTCLSFVTALDTLSYLVAAGRYRRVLLVASEISSTGLNYRQLEACSLFGDGAVAVVIGATPAGEGSRILAAHMETYSHGSDICQIEGGGTRVHPREYRPAATAMPGLLRADGPALDEDPRFLFSMNGRKVFRLATAVLPTYMARLFADAGGEVKSLADVDLVVPHQASRSAMELMRRRLDLPEDKWVYILPEYGNMIAASIPFGLHLSIRAGRIRRGDRVLCVGTSAGFSIGGVLLEY